MTTASNALRRIRRSMSDDREFEYSALRAAVSDDHANVRRIAELEAKISKIHASTRCMTFTHEWVLNGQRQEPGVYVLMRVGPVTDEPEATF